MACSRYAYNHNTQTINLFNRHITVGEQICTHLRGIVHCIPEELHKVLRVGNPNRPKTALSLIHPQNNAAPVGIRKGRVGFPQTSRQPNLSAFHLQLIAFSTSEQFIY